VKSHIITGRSESTVSRRCFTSFRQVLFSDPRSVWHWHCYRSIRVPGYTSL